MSLTNLKLQVINNEEITRKIVLKNKSKLHCRVYDITSQDLLVVGNESLAGFISLDDIEEIAPISNVEKRESVSSHEQLSIEFQHGEFAKVTTSTGDELKGYINSSNLNETELLINKSKIKILNAFTIRV